MVKIDLSVKVLVYCAPCDGSFYKDKVVAIVGGGDTAVTDAIYMSGLAKKVYVLVREANLMLQMFWFKD